VGGAPQARRKSLRLRRAGNAVRGPLNADVRPQIETMRVLIGGLLTFLSTSAIASGWNDYTMNIAPGFAVSRMNSFEVCLTGSDHSIIICPDDPPTFGPLFAYAVTDRAIITRHFGATRSSANPAMWDADHKREFFFYVTRAGARVQGPYSAAEWEHAKLPALDNVSWKEPRNPNTWTPLVGNAMIAIIALSYIAWPLAVMAFLYGGFVIYRTFRRPSRRP
jgi:hypothetical protein